MIEITGKTLWEVFEYSVLHYQINLKGDSCKYQVGLLKFDVLDICKLMNFVPEKSINIRKTQETSFSTNTVMELCG